MRYLSSALNGARFPPFNRATTCFFLFSLPTLPFFIVVCAAYLLLCPRQLHLSHTHKQKHVAKKRAKKTPIPPFISHSLFLLSSFSRKNSSTSFFFYFENSTDSFNDNWIVRKRVEKRKDKLHRLCCTASEEKQRQRRFFFFGVMVALVDLSLAIHCSTAFSPSHFPHLKAPFYL